ncbi:MAG: fibrobacter succinogenes major paralogous domain-containing protein [Chlorobium sp.]|nr:fibrobacter succinogenes major paralogous domain-containing protein [Chlorobium sp.]
MKYSHKALYGLLLLVITLMTSVSDLRAAEKDIDGHTINTVSIGSQVWMQENLDVSRYRNGEPIRYAATSQDWLDAAAKGEGAWSYYKNDVASNGKYGRLYNWYAVQDPRGLAPSGWHVPTTQEFKKLSTALGGVYVAGGKMKSTTLWLSPIFAADNSGQPTVCVPNGNVLASVCRPNFTADNSSRFTGMPGGMRGTDGGFFFMGENAFFWSSTESTRTISYYGALSYHLPTFVQGTEQNADGMSVRCIRN